MARAMSFWYTGARRGLNEAISKCWARTPDPTRRRDPLHPWIVRAALGMALLAFLLMAASPSIAQEQTPEPRAYVVQPGDTLFDIAQRFGSTVDAIAGANDIADPSLIEVGERLVIPSEEPERTPPPEKGAHSRLHRVRAGETLPFLAFRYGTTTWTLREENGLNRLGVLVPGQELIIPLPSVVASLTPRFPRISADPEPVVRGRTMVIEVEGDRAMDLRGTFLSQSLPFEEADGRYWALVGVGAMLAPGIYPMELVATEDETGDLLTMRETYTVTAGDYPRYNIVVPAGREELLQPALVETEQAQVNEVFAGVSQEKQWEGAFDVPLAGEFRNNAPFGQRRSYNGGPVNTYHTGHDFGADKGEPVLSPAAGTVVMAEPLKVRGRAVILDHGLGVFSGFWHLSRIDVEVGQRLSRADVVGLVGNSGRSTGPHLHWEMRVRGVPVDSLQWTRRAFP